MKTVFIPASIVQQQQLASLHEGWVSTSKTCNPTRSKENQCKVWDILLERAQGILQQLVAFPDVYLRQVWAHTQKNSAQAKTHISDEAYDRLRAVCVYIAKDAKVAALRGHSKPVGVFDLLAALLLQGIARQPITSAEIQAAGISRAHTAKTTVSLANSILRSTACGTLTVLPKQPPMVQITLNLQEAGGNRLRAGFELLGERVMLEFHRSVDAHGASTYEGWVYIDSYGDYGIATKPSTDLAFAVDKALRKVNSYLLHPHHV